MRTNRQIESSSPLCFHLICYNSCEERTKLVTTTRCCLKYNSVFSINVCAYVASANTAVQSLNHFEVTMRLM
jgi:hypothetical protein